MLELNFSTEIVDYYSPLSTIEPGRDIYELYSDSFLGVLSIGGDDSLYLSCENDNTRAQWGHRLILANVKTLVATKLADSNRFAIALVSGTDILYCNTDNPKQLNADSFTKVDYSVLTAQKQLKPNKLFMVSIEGGVTLEVNFLDESGRIERYFLNLFDGKPTDFTYYPLAANFSSIKTSALGRAKNQYVDGIYAFGAYGETTQLLYTPIQNIFGDTPPAPIRLKVPESGVEAVCVLPLKNKIGTHLFTVGGGAIYFYNHDMQVDMFHTDKPEPVKLASADFFIDAKQIITQRDGSRIYFWVLNESGMLSYCFAETEGDRLGRVSEPFLFRENVYDFDFVSNSDDLRLFICEKDKLLCGEHDAVTGFWTLQEMLIDSGLKKHSVFPAYVVKLRLEGNEIIAGIPARITIPNGKRFGMYVEGVFHNFNELITKTDGMGILDIVQPAQGLSPQDFTVSIGGLTLHIDPADTIHQKVFTLDSQENINNAQIEDAKGNKTPFASELSDEKAEVLSKSITTLKQAHESLTLKKPPLMANGLPPVLRIRYDNGNMIVDNGVAVFDSLEALKTDSLLDDIAYSVEEIFNFIKKKLSDFFEIVLGFVDEAWKLIVKIGKTVLTFVFKVIKHVFACAIKLLEFLGIPIDKLLKWLKCFLGIDDAIKIKDAMKHMLKLSLIEGANQIDEMKHLVGGALDAAIGSVEEWAGISGYSHTPDYSDTKKKYSPTPSVQNMFIFDLIFNRIGLPLIDLPELKSNDKVKAAADSLQKICEGLPTDVQNIPKHILTLFDELQELNLTSADDIISLMKKVLGVIAVKGLNTTKEIMGPVFDMLKTLLEIIAENMDKAIYIPILSEILSIFSVDEFSLLDLILFPAAFIVNIIFRLIGETLMPDETYKQIMSAKSFHDIENGTANSSSMSDIEAGNILPLGVKRGIVACLKASLATVSIVECFFQGLVYANPKAFGKKGQPIISMILTAVDFGLSFISGRIYSPMNDKISVTNGYTGMWHLKTSVSLLGSAIELFWPEKEPVHPEIPEEPNKIAPRTLAINVVGGTYGIVCLVGGILEVVAIVEAAKKSTSTSEESLDKAIYITEAVGYVSDDIRNMIDAAINIYYQYTGSKDPMPWYIITIRSIFGCLYCFSQIASLSILAAAD